MTDRGDPVRQQSSAAVNARIDRDTLRRIQRFAERDPQEVARHLGRLEREWDTERLLEMNAAALAMAGLALSSFRGKRWLVVPGLAVAFLLLHSLKGWSPPVPLLRRLGIRTRREIEAERYALKALRGDFQAVRPGAPAQAWRAVRE